MSDLELLPVSSARSSNLAFALFCLPRRRRADAMLFYRFCHTIDDIADRPGLESDEKKARLDAWLAAIETSLPPALEDLLERHSIDRTLLGEIIKGCASDIEPRRFDSTAALEDYCWRVACAVGLVSIKIFGCRDSRSEAYAVHLGHALQLTNILRDIGEDARQGRIYLPLEDMARFGVAEEEILNLRPGFGFRALLRHTASRARTRFAAAAPPGEDFGRLLPARIMSGVYQRILDRMESEDFPVFQKRTSLKRREKLACVMNAWLEGFKKTSSASHSFFGAPSGP
jgi:phytoene synthase